MERRLSEKRELCLRISYCNRKGGGIVGSFLVGVVAAAVVESLATLFLMVLHRREGAPGRLQRFAPPNRRSTPHTKKWWAVTLAL